MNLVGKKYLELEEKSIQFLILSTDSYHQTTGKVMEALINKENKTCLYVTTNKSCERLNFIYSKQGINTNNIFFVDAVAKEVGYEPKDKNCLFDSDPRNLSNLKIALINGLKRLENRDKFIIFDSLSTLKVYNDVGSISRFIHALTAEIRLWDVGALILSINKEFDDELIDTFSGFCDRTIRIV